MTARQPDLQGAKARIHEIDDGKRNNETVDGWFSRFRANPRFPPESLGYFLLIQARGEFVAVASNSNLGRDPVVIIGSGGFVWLNMEAELYALGCDHGRGKYRHARRPRFLCGVVQVHPQLYGLKGSSANPKQRNPIPKDPETPQAAFYAKQHP